MDTMTLSIYTKTEASDEEIERIHQITLERFPAYYCLTEAVTPEIIVSRLWLLNISEDTQVYKDSTGQILSLIEVLSINNGERANWWHI